jgi:iron complex transport system substrate-binding protein
MRRLLLLPLLLATLVLAACGGDDPATTGASATTTGGGDAFPVRITHARGTTTIPAAPKRVVTVGLRDQDTLLALGVKAVGAMDWFGQGTFAKWPWEDWGGQKPQVVSTGGFEINFERVAAQRPDLILAVYQELSAGDYAKLSKLAPTVAHDPRFKPYTTPWPDETRAIATSVGRKAEGERLIRGVQERFAAFRRAHPEYAGKSAVITDGNEGSFYAFSSSDPRGQLLKALGFAPSKPLDAAAKGEFGLELSRERLDLLDVDKLFVLVDRANRAKVFDDPAFQRLDVVRRGDVVEVPYYDAPQYGAAMAFSSVHSLPYAIEGAERLLAANEQAKAEGR